MNFDLKKVRISYTTKEGKEKYFWSFYLVSDTGVIIRIKANDINRDNYHSNTNLTLLTALAVEDKD